jgi:hypothetical protein
VICPWCGGVATHDDVFRDDHENHCRDCEFDCRVCRQARADDGE